MKIFIITKVSYTDFDMETRTPLSATKSRALAEISVNELNATRTDEEIRQELEYEIVTVPMLGE